MSEGGYEASGRKPHSLAVPYAMALALVISGVAAYQIENRDSGIVNEDVNPTPMRHAEKGRVSHKVHHLVYNPAVKRMQILLNVIDGSHLADDGKLGPDTRAEVERFQSDNDLAVTGTFNNPTVQALESRYHDELPRD